MNILIEGRGGKEFVYIEHVEYLDSLGSLYLAMKEKRYSNWTIVRHAIF
jgi:hypothetical protein